MTAESNIAYNNYRAVNVALSKRNAGRPPNWGTFKGFIADVGPKPGPNWELPKLPKDNSLLVVASTFFWRESLPKGNKQYEEYTHWKALHSRCKSPAFAKIAHYQAKGITVSDSWDDFYNFYKDMGPKPHPKYSVDRIDNDGNYCKENCRWADDTTQARNIGNVITYSVQGFTGCIPELAVHFNVNSNSIHKHIQKGNTIEHAITTLTKDNNITYLGLSLSKKGWADKLGIVHSTMYARFSRLSIEEALESYKPTD